MLIRVSPAAASAATSLPACWTQNPADEIVNSFRGETGSCVMAKNGMNPAETFRTGMCAERLVQDEVTRLVQSEPKRSTGEELHDIFRLRGNRRRQCTQSTTTAAANRRRGTHVAASSQARHSNCCEEGLDVLETIAIILIVLWLLGMVSGYTLGNFIWVLLVIAVVLFLVRLVSGRRVV